MLNVTESERQEFQESYRKMSESIVEFCKDYKSSNLLILRKSILRMQAIIKVLDAKIDSIENRAEYEALDVYTSRLDDIIAIHIDMFGFDNLYALILFNVIMFINFIIIINIYYIIVHINIHLIVIIYMLLRLILQKNIINSIFLLKQQDS